MTERVIAWCKVGEGYACAGNGDPFPMSFRGGETLTLWKLYTSEE